MGLEDRKASGPPVVNRWLSLARTPGARVRLFCLPHAGAGTAVYHTWKRLLPSWIEVAPIQIPGREGRLAEPSYTSLELLIEQMAESLVGHMDLPYAIFGHSMGSLLTIELAQRLRALGQPAPKYLFVSGRNAPHAAFKEGLLHKLPDGEFLAALAERYGAMPQEILDTPELLDIYLPILRADLVLLETHPYRAWAPLDCPIAAFCGEEDRIVTRQGLENWRSHTTGHFESHWLEGGHFYLSGASRRLLIDVISERLASIDPLQTSGSQAGLP